MYKSADTVGRVVSRVGAEFATPGGVDNLKAYRDGSISQVEYARNVSLDVATDAVASALGATVGGTGGGLAAGLVTAGAGTIPVASVGSAAGATAGYVASRAVKAVERTTAAEITRELNISRAITTSGGNGGGNQQQEDEHDKVTDAERKGINGRKGVEIKTPLGVVRNKDFVIEGRRYCGHALDRMQDRGIPLSVVKNAIEKGEKVSSYGGRIRHYDTINKLSVITDAASGDVISIVPGVL